MNANSLTVLDQGLACQMMDTSSIDGSFLNLLEADIRSGKHLTFLPDNLAQAMLAALHQPADLNADIEGDVAL